MNGTHLNGLRLTTPTQVRPGDHLRFGSVTYQLTYPGLR
jgi:pSer/pThr/pTyr-binding forkhead associated (FHA) protein